MLLKSASAGDSKSRVVIVSAPPEEIVKKVPSVPLFDQVTVSLAVKVNTEVDASGIEMELVAPVADDGPVIVGAVVSGTYLIRMTPEPPAPGVPPSQQPEPPPPPPLFTPPDWPVLFPSTAAPPPPSPPAPAVVEVVEPPPPPAK